MAVSKPSKPLRTRDMSQGPTTQSVNFLSRAALNFGAETAGSIAPSTGHYRGHAIRQVKGALSIAEDGAEELSVAQGEKLEDEDIKKRKAEKGEHAMLAALAKIQELRDKVPDIPGPHALMPYQRSVAHSSDPGEILQKLRENFKEPSHRFAALSFAHEYRAEKGEKDASFRALEAAQRQLEEEEGPQIRADLNISQSAWQVAKGDEAQAKDLRTLYRERVFSAQGLGHMYQAILGVDEQGNAHRNNPTRDIQYLLQAASVDLQSAEPSSAKEFLLSTMNQIHALETLQTVQEEARVSLIRLQHSYGIGQEHTPQEVVGAIVDMVEAGYGSPEDFIELAHRIGARDPIAAEIAALQEFQEISVQFPERIFSGSNDRESLIEASRIALDQTIAREEQEEAL